MEEIEVKYLNIDAAQIEQRILALGGKKEFSVTYRVVTFDFPDLRLNDQAAWVRLRSDGEITTLAYKQRQGVKTAGENDDTMLEYEVEVSDFESTAKILRGIGLTEKFVEEKRRIRFRLDDVELDLDEMPLLKPYLEIEAKSWQAIDAAIKRLDLDPGSKRICSAFQIYEQSGINMLDYQILTFAKQVKRQGTK